MASTLDVRRGETLESSGVRFGENDHRPCPGFLLKPTAGAILHNGIDPQGLPRKAFQSHRRDYQIIFQDQTQR